MAFHRDTLTAATERYQTALFSLFSAHGRLGQDEHVAAIGAVLDLAGHTIANGRHITLEVAELAGIPPEMMIECVGMRLAGDTIHLTLRPLAYRHAGVFFEMLRRMPVMLAIAGRLSGDHELTCEIGDAAYNSSLGFCSYDARTCLVPDADFFLSGGHDRFRRICATQLPPWDQRSQRVFWRGSSTGNRRHEPPGDGEADDFTWLQRLLLCRLAAEPGLAELCDISIGALVQINEPHLIERIQQAGLVKPTVPREAFLQHRVVVDVDGNSNAWSGLFCSLLSRSCIIKVESERGYRQWYYDRLAPWQTHVPVRADLSDFAEAVAWTMICEADSHRLAETAAELAASLSFEACMEDAVTRAQRWLGTRVPFAL